MIGGPLALAVLGLTIVIPGYLVWVALIIALAATIITYLIGKSLPQDNKNLECAEADFRQELTQLNDEAENIAEEHAEVYYQTSLGIKLQDVKKLTNQKLETQTKVVAFQSFYSQLSGILPSLLAAPLYFTGLIEIGQLMQIGMSFAQVSSSLSWFVDSFENLSTYKASVERITELQQKFEKGNQDSDHKSILRKERNKDTLKIKHLNLRQPEATSTNYMLRNLNLKLTPGEHVLIKGRSGTGKSTLFKAISGTWRYGEGKVVIPSGKSFYFLPQRPTIPHRTLKAVLAYPEPEDTYTENQYISVLKAVERMDDFIPRLNEIQPWSNRLSYGEQQRIAFARALLKKPDWLFLDESTSALDEESEEHVYKLLAEELKNTTIVSIGHRSTVEKYHSKVVLFSVNQEREIKVDEYTNANSEQKFAHF